MPILRLTRNLTRNLIQPWVIALSLALSGCAQSLFYYPDRVLYETPAALGMQFEQVQFSSADGTRLTGWMIPAQDAAQDKATAPDANSARAAKGTVIHFHGNAQNMSAHWRFAGWLAAEGFNVFVFDYRGYGASEGSPEPRGVYEDSVAAIRHVRGRPDVDPARLLLFGQSLGGTNAIAAAGGGEMAGVRALAIESAFYSYSAIASDKISGAGALMNDDYSAEKFIARISPVPLLLIHGTADPVIGHHHSERLLARARAPKQLILVPQGGHIESMTPRFHGEYRARLLGFFDAALAR